MIAACQLFEVVAHIRDQSPADLRWEIEQLAVDHVL
jgi:hypothetical protein